MATTGQDLTLRPMRAADRDRVMEISRDIWEGHDYIPRVFDDWLADAGASFQAAELDGVVVGLQRVRPYAQGLVWYEGLRVWFPDGPDSPNIALVAVAVEMAKSWTKPASILSYAFYYLRARMTGKTPVPQQIAEIKSTRL